MIEFGVLNNDLESFRVQTTTTLKIKTNPISVLPEVAISRQLGYFCDPLGVKKSPWRVGYFVAILVNDLIISFSGRFLGFY